MGKVKALLILVLSWYFYTMQETGKESNLWIDGFGGKEWSWVGGDVIDRDELTWIEVPQASPKVYFRNNSRRTRFKSWVFLALSQYSNYR